MIIKANYTSCEISHPALSILLTGLISNQGTIEQLINLYGIKKIQVKKVLKMVN
jgi:hypothetical protein